jgi:predicted transcriptional regulator
MAGSTITIRTSAEIVTAITKLAESMNRSRNWVIEAALRNYLDTQAWQVEGIRKALAQADADELVSHEDVFSALGARIENQNESL